MGLGFGHMGQRKSLWRWVSQIPWGMKGEREIQREAGACPRVPRTMLWA